MEGNRKVADSWEVGERRFFPGVLHRGGQNTTHYPYILNHLLTVNSQKMLYSNDLTRLIDCKYSQRTSSHLLFQFYIQKPLLEDTQLKRVGFRAIERVLDMQHLKVVMNMT